MMTEARYEICKLDHTDQVLADLINAHRVEYGYAPTPVPVGNWQGLYDNGELAVVYCDHLEGRDIYIDAMCPVKGTRGVRGILRLIQTYYAVVNSGIVESVIYRIFERDSWLKHLVEKAAGHPIVPEINQYRYRRRGS